MSPEPNFQDFIVQSVRTLMDLRRACGTMPEEGCAEWIAQAHLFASRALLDLLMFHYDAILYPLYANPVYAATHRKALQDLQAVFELEQKIQQEFYIDSRCPAGPLPGLIPPVSARGIRELGVSTHRLVCEIKRLYKDTEHFTPSCPTDDRRVTLVGEFQRFMGLSLGFALQMYCHILKRTRNASVGADIVPRREQDWVEVSQFLRNWGNIQATRDRLIETWADYLVIVVASRSRQGSTFSSVM